MAVLSHTCSSSNDCSSQLSTGLEKVLWNVSNASNREGQLNGLAFFFPSFLFLFESGFWGKKRDTKKKNTTQEKNSEKNTRNQTVRVALLSGMFVCCLPPSPFLTHDKSFFSFLFFLPFLCRLLLNGERTHISQRRIPSASMCVSVSILRYTFISMSGEKCPSFRPGPNR